MVIILISQKREEGRDCQVPERAGVELGFDSTAHIPHLSLPQMLVCFMCGCRPGVLVYMAVWFIPGQGWA